MILKEGKEGPGKKYPGYPDLKEPGEKRGERKEQGLKAKNGENAP